MTEQFNDFHFLNGKVVTERITRICAEKGHAYYKVNGQDTGICPRCGANYLSPNTQFPPGYRDPNWKGDTHPEIHDHENDPDDVRIPEGVMPPSGTPRSFTTRVNDLAEFAFDRFIYELVEGEFSSVFSQFAPQERAAFFGLLSDAFGDSTDQ